MTTYELSPRLVELMTLRNEECDDVATEAYDYNISTHRSAWVEGCQVLFFGNDCFGYDERSRREVELLLDEVAQRGWTVTGFGLSDDNGDEPTTWCLRVRTKRRKQNGYEMHQLVWGCWFKACAEASPRIGSAA
jgi:hypothetical protein